MLEVTGSFSSLLQSTGQFGNLNFFDGFDSSGDGWDGPGAVFGSDSGEPNRSSENLNPDPPLQHPAAENFLGWAGGWPDLAIYTSPEPFSVIVSLLEFDGKGCLRRALSVILHFLLLSWNGMRTII